MKQWLSNSIICSFLCRFVALVKAIWKRIEKKIVWLYSNSTLKRLVNKAENYLAKKPNLEKSLFYRFMSKFGSFLKRAAAGLNAFFANQFRYSFFWNLLNDTDNGFRRGPYVLTGLVLAGFLISYGAATAVKGNFGVKSAVISAALFITAATMLLAKANIKKAVCDSMLYRLIFKAYKIISQ